MRQLREQKDLTQVQLGEQAGIRNELLYRLERGENVQVEQYERVARALGYRNALEMFRTGGDPMSRKLQRLWAALPDDEARKDVLQLMKAQIVADEEPSATSS